MHWLLDPDGHARRLQDDVVLWLVLGRLAAGLPASAAAPRPQRLVSQLAGQLHALASAPDGQADPADDAPEPPWRALASPRLSSAAIRSAVAGYLRRIGDQLPADVLLLGCRMDALATPGADGAGACADLGSVLRWTIVDRPSALGRRRPTRPVLGLVAAGGSDLLLDTAPELSGAWPDNPADRAGLYPLRLGLKGAVSGQLAAGGDALAPPAGLGSAGAAAAVGVATEAACRLDCCLLCPGDALVGEAAGRFLATAPSPFDLRGVAAALADRRLLCLRLRAAGTLLADAGLRLGAPLAVLGGMPGQVDAGLRVAVQQRGSFELIIRAADAMPGAVEVRLRRQESADGALAAGLAVRLDAGALQAALAPVLGAAADAAGALDVLAGRLLPPSRLARPLLRQAVAAQLQAPQHEALPAELGPWLGPAAADAPVAALVQRLAQALDTAPTLWAADASVDSLLRTAVADGHPPLDEVARGRLVTVLGPVLKPVLEPVLGMLRQRLREALDELDHDAQEALRLALRRAGQDPAGARDGSLLEAAADALDGYRRSLVLLGRALGRAQDARLSARWRAERRRSRRAALDLTLVLDPGHVDAPVLYRQVLGGSLAGALAAARQGQGAVRAVSGGLSRLLATEERRAVDLSLLDLRVGRAQLFSGQVRIEAGVDGAVRVQGRAESTASVGLLGESRRLSALSAFALAAAPQTRQLSFGLTLSHRDRDLAPEDAAAYFAALEAPAMALLPAGTGAAAAARLRALTAQSPDTPRAGELRLWMALDQIELERLMQLARPAVGRAGNPLDTTLIAQTAIDAIFAATAISGSAVTLRNMDRLARRLDLGADARGAVHAIARGRRRPGELDFFSPDGLLFDRMARIAARGRQLAELVELMRELYGARPRLQRGAWDLDDLAARQRRMDEILQFWFAAELEDDIRLTRLLRDGELLNPQLRPHALALLKALKTLATPVDTAPDNEAAPLLASLFLEQEGETELVLA